MFKKVICLIAAFLLIFSLVACNEPKETDAPEKTDDTDYNVWYSIDYNSTYASVTGIENFDGGKVVIASEYRGVPVTTISSGAFMGYTTITEIVLPDTITSIGNDAFSGCKGLNKINIPAGVQYMGVGVFNSCSNLVINLEAKEVPNTWPENWAAESKSVSFGTKELPEFTDNNGANNNNNNTNNNNNNSTNNNTSTSTYSEGLIFEYYSSGFEKSYTVKSVGTCKDEHINIPPTYKGFNDREEVPVVAISDRAFKNATFMKHVTIPDSVRSIGKFIFEGCSNIESIKTPVMPEVLGEFFGVNAFDGAEKISQHTMTGYNSSLKMVDYYIPTSLRSITMTEWDYCYGMFSGCYFLTSITITNNQTKYPTLGAYAFYGCKGLTSIKLSAKCEGIGDYAFYGCENLKSVTFYDDNSYIKLEKIGDSAFSGCKSLENFTIPDNVVKTIGDSAFSDCESLKSITIPATVTYVGYKAFDSGCKSLTSIRVLASSSNRNQWDDRWNDTTITPTYN